MAGYSYERLSAQDATFLWAERENQPMHVGALSVFEAQALRLEDGGFDIARFRKAVEAVLHWIPRYRQKLQWIPLENWPVWVDDRRFDIGYHIRHIALPRPGRLEQLKELVGRIHSRPLDRRRPLWEMWVIEGVEGGEQFALLNKVHHCMIDGAAGADLAQILMSPSASAEIAEPLPYLPRPEPSPAELLHGSFVRSVSQTLGLVRRGVFGAREEEAARGPGVEERLRAFGEMLRYALRPAEPTPINGELGPHRRVEWLTMPLEDLRELRRVVDCTLNDLILATVAGAMRRYLFRHRVDGRRIEFRVVAPVSTRRPEHDRRQGNHVSSWIVTLPLGIDEPLERLASLREQTQRLKHSGASLAVDTLMQVAEFLPAPLIERSVGLAGAPAHMIVTNVPGPQFPLYSVGAHMLGMYPLVPLLPGSGLGIALFSYEGRLCWGFNGDHEILGDLSDFVGDVNAAFEELRAAVVAHFVARRTAPPEVEARDEEGNPVRALPVEPAARKKRRRKATPAAAARDRKRA